jgi:hypothetical protein
LTVPDRAKQALGLFGADFAVPDLQNTAALRRWAVGASFLPVLIQAG